MEGSSAGTSASTSTLLPAPQQGVVRDPLPPASTHLARPSLSTRDHHETTTLPSMSTGAPRPSSSEVWTGAIARVQQQVVYNTSLLESHRRQMHDMDQAIGRLHADLSHVVGVINDFQVELREIRRKPVANEPSFKHDSGDLDVLANQIAAITSKANEVEGLKMQLELMKNRIKRMEEQSPLPAQKSELPSISGREQPYVEAHQPVNQHLQHPHQQLPPLRPTSTSSRDERVPVHHHLPPPVASSHGTPPYPPSEARHHPSEPPRTQTAHNGFRQSEPSFPTPATVSGWRPAESSSQHRTPHGNPSAPPTAILSPMPPRPNVVEAERQTGGWASINLPMKRPFEDQRQSPNEVSHASGSPKRTKLAPIVPRGTASEERHHGHSQTPLENMTPIERSHARSDAPSENPAHLTQALPAPASTDMSSYRFVSSSHYEEAPGNWRSAAEHTPVQPPGQGTRARGRSGRTRGRPRTGGSASQHHQYHEEHAGARSEETKWRNGAGAPNGHLNPMYNPQSPSQRDNLARRPGGNVDGIIGHDHLPRPPSSDYPATPLHGVHSPFQLDSSSSKKSRTKPIRNSEGILIRKDGRPDMRSVSSANNLRKVHAKKEAERAETEGRSPPSTAADDSHSPEDTEHAHRRSEDTPASTRDNPEHRGEGEGGQTRVGSQGRTRELMNKIFPQGYDGAGRHGEREMKLSTSLGTIKLETETRDADDRIHKSPGDTSSELQEATPVSEPKPVRPLEPKDTTASESTEV
nr:hypothetical protein CFP56_22350 [Quercus suber]